MTTDTTVPTSNAVTVHAVSLISLNVYKLDEEQLRADIQVSDVRTSIAGEGYNDHSSVGVVARVCLPEDIYRDLDTCGGQDHSRLSGNLWISQNGETMIQAHASRSVKVDFRGIRKDATEKRRSKAVDALDRVNTYTICQEIIGEAIDMVIMRVRDAVNARNEREREAFVRTVGSLDNWKPSEGDEPNAEEQAAKQEAEELERQIQELEKRREAALERAHEAHRGDVLRDIDGTDFGAAPAEWVAEAREKLEAQEAQTSRGPFGF